MCVQCVWSLCSLLLSLKGQERTTDSKELCFVKREREREQKKEASDRFTFASFQIFFFPLSRGKRERIALFSSFCPWLHGDCNDEWTEEVLGKRERGRGALLFHSLQFGKAHILSLSLFRKGSRFTCFVSIQTYLF